MVTGAAGKIGNTLGSAGTRLGTVITGVLSRGTSNGRTGSGKGDASDSVKKGKGGKGPPSELLSDDGQTSMATSGRGGGDQRTSGSRLRTATVRESVHVMISNELLHLQQVYLSSPSCRLLPLPLARRERAPRKKSRRKRSSRRRAPTVAGHQARPILKIQIPLPFKEGGGGGGGGGALSLQERRQRREQPWLQGRVRVRVTEKAVCSERDGSAGRRRGRSLQEEGGQEEGGQGGRRGGGGRRSL